MSLITFLYLFVISSISYIAITAYLKYYNIAEQSQYRCFSIKSITIAVVTAVISYLALIMSITINVVNEMFPTNVLTFLSLPIIILILYVVKDSNFTYPLIIKLVKTHFCFSESEVDPDHYQDNSVAGIYMGPPRSRELTDISVAGIYMGPPRSKELTDISV